MNFAKHIFFVLSIANVGFVSVLRGQSTDCVTKILELENQMTIEQFEVGKRATHFKYVMRTEDWEGDRDLSTVEVYRNRNNLHLFTERADMYVDVRNMYMVLKPQRSIIVSNTPENVLEHGYNDDFKQLRINFLKNCIIKECRKVKGEENLKALKLEVGEDIEGLIAIHSMTYLYNEAESKIVSTLVEYETDYKIKFMEIEYVEFEPSISYTFKKPDQYVANGKGILHSKYQGYQLTDERD